jgi:xanthine dehydrogenase accessory factor
MSRAVTERLLAAIEATERAVVFTVIEGARLGSKALVLESGEQLGDGVPAAALEQANELIRGARSRILEVEDARVFADVYGPPPRLVVIGAVDTADALCAAAKLLGWETIVADARAKFTTQERIPHADRLIVEWPEEALAEVQPDHATAIVVLTHDDKFDIPALKAALASDAFYIGALGSRRNQERRRERLLEEGVAAEELQRIAGPCGLDLGGETQQETALSILGEIVATRFGRSGGRLRDAKQRIHAEVV